MIGAADIGIGIDDEPIEPAQPSSLIASIDSTGAMTASTSRAGTNTPPTEISPVVPRAVSWSESLRHRERGCGAG
jgi:hypothetical protein